MAHWEFWGTPCSDFSQRRTAFWSSGSRPAASTMATHSSSVCPVRSRSPVDTAAIISSGVGTSRGYDRPRAGGTSVR